jgi:predicted lipoprotein with Yx(FWY)xxD motif
MRGIITKLTSIVAATTLGLTACTVGQSETGGARPPAQPNRIVVDADGFTLYRYARRPVPVADRSTDPRVDPLPDRRRLDCDPGTPPRWPVVPFRPTLPLLGIDHRTVGYISRADGTRQLAVDGCPAYRYFGDRRPGDTAGDGIAGEWFALRTDAGTGHQLGAR